MFYTISGFLQYTNAFIMYCSPASEADPIIGEVNQHLLNGHPEVASCCQGQSRWQAITHLIGCHSVLPALYTVSSIYRRNFRIALLSTICLDQLGEKRGFLDFNDARPLLWRRVEGPSSARPAKGIGTGRRFWVKWLDYQYFCYKRGMRGERKK